MADFFKSRQSLGFIVRGIQFENASGRFCETRLSRYGKLLMKARVHNTDGVKAVAHGSAQRQRRDRIGVIRYYEVATTLYFDHL